MKREKGIKEQGSGGDFHLNSPWLSQQQHPSDPSMTRYSTYVRHRIITMNSHGMRRGLIRSTLLTEDGVTVSLSGLSNFLKKVRDDSCLVDKPRAGRSSKITLQVKNIIDGALVQNGELNATDLQNRITRATGNVIPLSTIRRARKKLRWVQEGARYCQLIKIANRPKRLEFAQRCLANADTFDDVVWTDESTIQIERHAKKAFRKVGTPPVLKGKPKHPLKVHVWAGISLRGATGIGTFDGIMRADYYANTILRNWVKPFLSRRFGAAHRFQQDNDPKHTSLLARAVMNELNINWWITPPESPDMNPIENLWAELKGYLRKHVKPSTKDELVRGIQDYWSNRLTQQKCQKYIRHLRKVLPAVVEREGRASGY